MSTKNLKKLVSNIQDRSDSDCECFSRTCVLIIGVSFTFFFLVPGSIEFTNEIPFLDYVFYLFGVIGLVLIYCSLFFNGKKIAKVADIMGNHEVLFLVIIIALMLCFFCNFIKKIIKRPSSDR